MPRNLLLVFNHKLTPHQRNEAYDALGVNEIVSLSPDLQNLWSFVPPDLPEIAGYIRPIHDWVSSNGSVGDFILIQGDFGACYLTVQFAFEQGLVPVYSTTQRNAVEEHDGDGTVRITHAFRHQAFRKYGV